MVTWALPLPTPPWQRRGGKPTAATTTPKRETPCNADRVESFPWSLTLPLRLEISRVRVRTERDGIIGRHSLPIQRQAKGKSPFLSQSVRNVVESSDSYPLILLVKSWDFARIPLIADMLLI